MTYLICVLISLSHCLFDHVPRAGHMFRPRPSNMKATQVLSRVGNTVWSGKEAETEYGIRPCATAGFVRHRRDEQHLGRPSARPDEPVHSVQAAVAALAWC